MVAGDSVRLVTERVSMVDGKASDLHKYCVVVGDFKQVFNARSFCTRINEAEANNVSYVVMNPEKMYYVVYKGFDTKEDAIKHAKYILTPFARALLYANKQGRTSAKPTWKDVPIQDYTEPWWNESIEQINEHLFDKYDIPQDIRDFVNKNIQPRSEENIRNM